MAVTIAQDNFNRTLSGSWGSADTGGAWTLGGGDAVPFSVSPGKGNLTLSATVNREATLTSVSSTNAVVRVALSTSSAYSGGAQSFTIIGRKIGTTFYQARVRIESGLIRLYTMRDETALTGSTTIAHTYVADEIIWCELSVTGTNPTVVAGKIWLDGSAEPGTYQQTTNDSTVGYQVAGIVGLHGGVSTGGAAATLSFANYTVVDPTATLLDTPTVALTYTDPTTIGGSDGTVTATWTAVSGADHYESCLRTGSVSTGFVADDTNAISPKTYTGLMAGTYTVAVRAKAA